MYKSQNKKNKFTILYNLGFDNIEFNDFVEFQNYVEMLNKMGINDVVCTRTETTELNNEVIEINQYFMIPSFVKWGVSWTEKYNKTIQNKILFPLYI